MAGAIQRALGPEGWAVQLLAFANALVGCSVLLGMLLWDFFGYKQLIWQLYCNDDPDIPDQPEATKEYRAFVEIAETNCQDEFQESNGHLLESNPAMWKPSKDLARRRLANAYGSESCSRERQRRI
eukprot:SAG31_NODE_27831_length_419_cov_1.125000_1_plen_125_part_10